MASDQQYKPGFRPIDSGASDSAPTNEKHPPSCDRRMSLAEMVEKLECANECLRKRLCELECRYSDLSNENNVLKKMVRESC